MTTALDQRKAVQKILGVTPDGKLGPKSHAAFDVLAGAPDASAWPPEVNPMILRGDGTWPFFARIDGDDIVCENIAITAFGGNGDGTNGDPQDNGDTASGKNTMRERVVGCSFAVDGRTLKLSTGEHVALDGAPIPPLRTGGHLAFFQPVEVTISGQTVLLSDGWCDLGPGKQATHDPSEPHALDLTVPAAAIFRPDIPLHRLSREFSARGSFRILGGAKLI